MSKIKDTIEEKLGSWFVDTYKDHPTHLVYRTDCSECYKQAPEVKLSDDGYIKLVENELRPPLTREDEEQLTLDKRMEEADGRAIDEANGEL